MNDLTQVTTCPKMQCSVSERLCAIKGSWKSNNPGKLNRDNSRR